MHKQAKQSKQAKIKNALRVEKFVAICQDKVGCFVPNIQCFAIYKCLEMQCFFSKYTVFCNIQMS